MFSPLSLAVSIYRKYQGLFANNPPWPVRCTEGHSLFRSWQRRMALGWKAVMWLWEVKLGQTCFS